MKNKTGVAAAAILVVIAVIGCLVFLSGLGKEITPAQSLSPAAQKLLDPTKKVSWWESMAGLENKKQQLAILKVSIDVINGEIETKLNQSSIIYAAISSVLAAYAAAHGMSIYKNTTMYSEEQHQAGIEKAVNGNKTTT